MIVSVPVRGDCQASLAQQLSESRDHCDLLNRQRDDVMQELDQVKDELTSEKQLRLNVCTALFLVCIYYHHNCSYFHGYTVIFSTSSQTCCSGYKCIL